MNRSKKKQQKTGGQTVEKRIPKKSQPVSVKSTNNNNNTSEVKKGTRNNINQDNSNDLPQNGKNKKNQTVATQPISINNKNVKMERKENDDPLKSPPKFIRSNSFSLGRKISKIYNSLTGSKDNLTKINEHEESSTTTSTPSPTTQNSSPFRLSRSVTFNVIPLRRRRLVTRESKLEQLSEESVPDSTAPQPQTPTKVDLVPPKETNQVVLRPKKQSTVTETDDYKKRRGSSLFSSLRRTFSSRSEKSNSLNPKWSASLMNLQQIDPMVSYEDFSFINYDKFNTYEAELEKRLSQTDLNRRYLYGSRMSIDSQTLLPLTVSNTDTDTVDAGVYSTNPSVKRRTLLKNKLATTINRRSGHFNAADDSNYDKAKNLFRQSLDGEKLKNLNQVDRNSFRLSDYIERNAEDLLLLDNYLNSDKTVKTNNEFDSQQSVGKLKRNSIDEQRLRVQPTVTDHCHRVSFYFLLDFLFYRLCFHLFYVLRKIYCQLTEIQ